MRLGDVYLLAVMMAGSAAAQRHARDGMNTFAEPLNNAMQRADGTTFAPNFDAHFERPHDTGPAISFRHYTHQPMKKARQQFAKARKAANEGNETLAVNNLTEAVRLDPGYFDAHMQLGIIRLQQEQFKEALVHLETALTIDQSSQLVQGLAAAALLGQGNFIAAETAAKRALQLGPPLPFIDTILRLIKTYRPTVLQTATATTPRP